MVRLLLRFILFGLFSFLFFAPPAEAGVPVPSEVANDIVEPEQTKLVTQRAKLLVRRDSIKLGVAIHNVKCSKVVPGSSIVDECRANQEKLQAEISNYTAYVHSFNSLLQKVPRLIDTGQDPWLSNSMTSYFLINRDESYTIHNAIIYDMVHQSATGTQGPAQPADELSDREILEPLDYERTIDLNQAVQIINKRQGAREREAVRKASKRMLEEMSLLEKEGVLRPGDNTIEKEKNDPVFRERLNLIFSKITKDEISDIHNAQSLALEEIIMIIETNSSIPKHKRFHEILKEIYKRRDIAHDMINKFALRDMSDEIDLLKQEGYYKDGDDLVEKDRYDQDFRTAMNKAVRKVLKRQYEAEHNIQLKILKEIQSTVRKSGSG